MTTYYFAMANANLPIIVKTVFLLAKEKMRYFRPNALLLFI